MRLLIFISRIISQTVAGLGHAKREKASENFLRRFDDRIKSMDNYYPKYVLKMQPDKAEFKRMVELMGWSKSEAARRLHKTPSAINHLLNPGHPNKPTGTMMALLRHIMARERPDQIDGQTSELKGASAEAKPNATQLSLREQEIIEGLQKLPAADQEKVIVVIEALLRTAGRKGA
jgi:hypothetical protein